MRVQLNLASRPFVELGPLYMRLRIFIILLAILAVPLWMLLNTEKRKAAEAAGRLAAVQQNIQALEAQRTAFQAEMRQPQNAVVLSQAQFLNRTFASKAFSWTAIMMDLENVLPSGVQVLSIDPLIDSKTGKVTIRLRVNGPHDKGVELVRNLERSRRFLAPRLVRETAESNQNQRQLEPVSTAPANVNFDLLSDYNPLPDTATRSAAHPEGEHVASTAKRHRPKPAASGAASAPAAPVPGGGMR
jgi:type IV pilus assembly protein PilN